MNLSRAHSSVSRDRLPETELSRRSARESTMRSLRSRERRSLRRLASASTNKYLHCTTVHLKAVGKGFLTAFFKVTLRRNRE